jgi:hypothetical protein
MFTKDLKYLCDSIAIVESSTDRYGWGNATEDEPAFLVYLGFYTREQAIAMKDTLIRFYRCESVQVRPAKRMAGLDWELKAYGLQRYGDSYAFGLDDLIESVRAREMCETEPEPLHHLAYFDTAWAS